MILYKRNAQGKPIFWNIYTDDKNIIVKHGLVGKEGTKEIINTHRKLKDEIDSLVKAKRKTGYKELKDLYDNAPDNLTGDSLINYLNTYLPKDNTHEDGKFIPMLCKTLDDNKPFEKHDYFGQWKINGERCIITATKSDDLFGAIKLNYRSREGVDWTDKLAYLDQHLLPCIKGNVLDMMIEEGVALDGEMYIPGYDINHINSFIKNNDLPQHKNLQFWCYDLCMENIKAINRQRILSNNIHKYPYIFSKEDHLNNKERFVLLPFGEVKDFQHAAIYRDRYIELGFEGLIVRDMDAEYQFGGKRNNAMLKYKKIKDGYFKIIAIKEDKRGLPVFTLLNDINDNTFDATINATHDYQSFLLSVKDTLIGKLALVEFRERSGVKDVPFHSKIIRIKI